MTYVCHFESSDCPKKKGEISEVYTIRKQKVGGDKDSLVTIRNSNNRIYFTQKKKETEGSSKTEIKVVQLILYPPILK